jgi:hypothetical protein
VFQAFEQTKNYVYFSPTTYNAKNALQKTNFCRAFFILPIKIPFFSKKYVYLQSKKNLLNT